MGYGKRNYEAAAAELLRRRQTAESAAQTALEDFYSRCPQARGIKEQMAANSAEAVKAILRGGDVRGQLEKLWENARELSGQYDALLDQNGYTRRDITPQYHCARCKDTGIDDGRLCSCFKELQRKLAYEKLSASVPLGQCRFETFSLEYYKGDSRAYKQMENILRACKGYAEKFRANSPSLLFKGGTGLGKTHLSLAIAGEVLEKGFGVVYGSAQSFALNLERERFDRREDDEEDTHSQLLSCDLLILDDLGTEFPSSYTAAALYDVLNCRMLASKPTIISTNLTMAELEKRYGERFASRIAGYYGMLEFLGSDVRIEKRKLQSKV